MESFTYQMMAKESPAHMMMKKKGFENVYSADQKVYPMCYRISCLIVTSQHYRRVGHLKNRDKNYTKLHS